jgi:formylmethanofuran dehydrogenase subunit E
MAADFYLTLRRIHCPVGGRIHHWSIMMDYAEIVKFHGHECPGLAIGYRMARAAMKALNVQRSSDEEIVAIVENNACGVDALQCISGCTFGKGNLLFRDYGKQVYTLYSRATGKGVRVVFRDKSVPERLRGDRPARIKFILEALDAEILSLSRIVIDEPEPARIIKSVSCAICGESVMETRLRKVNGKLACIPCAEGQVGHQRADPDIAR